MTILAPNLLKLSSISDFTKETINELRDTIWAMNKSEISLEDLQARISNFVDKAGLSANTIKFNFNSDNEVPKDLQFTSVKGMNIYRIAQEAINNAIKYSTATEIHVNVAKNEDSLEFSIKDNGKGFDENSIEFGNGIHNMKKRAQDIGANLNIESHIDKGTAVILTIKS